MAFPEDVNNLDSAAVDFNSAKSTTWAVRLYRWIRDSVLPAIKGMVPVIQSAKSTADAANTAAQARLTLNMSNLTRGVQTFRNFTGHNLTNSHAGAYLKFAADLNSIQPSTASQLIGEIRAQGGIGSTVGETVFYTAWARQIREVTNPGHITQTVRTVSPTVTQLLNTLISLPASAVLTGVERSTYQAESTPGSGTYVTLYRWRFKYRTFS